MDAPAWDVTVFTKNRDRLLKGDIARGFLAAILADPQVKPLLSTEHFSVDGTLIEAWASMKSFRPKDGSGEPPGPGRNAERDYRGEKRSNETHASTTDPDARLFRKAAGQSSRLCHMGHVRMENRSGLVVDAMTTTATGTAEREAATAMAEAIPGAGRVTLGADKAYDTADFVAEMRRLGVTPHVAQNTNGRRSAIDGRTTRHAGYAVRVRVRKRIRRCSAGSRPSPGCARPVIAAPPGWAGCSPSPRPPTTWCVSPSFWLARCRPCSDSVRRHQFPPPTQPKSAKSALKPQITDRKIPSEPSKPPIFRSLLGERSGDDA